MHPVYAAAAVVARESFDSLLSVLDALPAGALDWTPAPGTNSVAVLTEHTVTSARFFLAAAAGRAVDYQAYLAGERAEAFATRDRSAASLRADIWSLLNELDTFAGAAGEAELAARLAWANREGIHRTGAEALFSAIGHVREHIGQAQLLRDLWLAKGA